MEKKLVWKVTRVEIRFKEVENPAVFESDIINAFQDGYLFGVMTKDWENPEGLRKQMFPIQDIHKIDISLEPTQE